MERLPVYILAGGKSSRFGSDKARAPWGSAPLIQHIAETLSEVASRITVVAEVPHKYQDLGLTTIADRHPGHGPLSGLDAALAHTSGESWLLLVSCDLASLQPSWPASLIAAKTPASYAVAFRSTHWEPIFALYHTRTHPEVTRRLAAGDFSMQRFLDSVRATAVPLPPDWPALPQANTPSELAEIVKQASKGS